jgi:hypothetical protein
VGAKYTVQTWTDGSGGATPVSAARLAVMEVGIRDASMGRSTTFPGSPVDGDIHVYPADTTNRVMWQFMWRAASSKWEFIGGSPLYAEVATSEGTASTTYAALATAGPSIVLPFAGDWMIEIGAYATQTADGAAGLMSYDIGGTGAVDADALEHLRGTNSSAMSGTFGRRKAGLTAVTLTAKYKTAGAGTATFKKRWMKATPVSTP